MAPKRLQLLHELMPHVAVVGVLADPAFPSIQSLITDLQTAARTLGLQLLVLNARTDSELEMAFATFSEQRVGAVLVGNSALYARRTEPLAALAARYALPAMFRQNHQRRGVRDRLLASSSGSGHHSRHLTKSQRSLGGSGVASVYSDRHTASGERMNSGAMTAAHRTLPFGTKVTVVNNHTGRSVVVRINDRGPFVHGRVIDLSPAAARAIGVNGLAAVSLKVGG
jgi:rare lipoprotein A